MNIVVCVKQVPDPEGKITVEKGTNAIQSSDLRYVINPLDLVAVEEALRIKERDIQSRVTVISLGPRSAKKALRQALSLGCDDAFLLCDPAFDNGDNYATALALAKAVRLVPHDLVLCGERADDTQAGQVGTHVAQMLGIPLVRRAVKVHVDFGSKRIRIHSKLQKGDREQVECTLPVLITVESGLNNLRYPTLRAIVKAKRQTIRGLDARRLELPPRKLGIPGSKTEIIRLAGPMPKMKGLLIPDSSLSPAERLKMIAGGGITQRKSNELEGDPVKVASQLVQLFKRQKIIPG